MARAERASVFAAEDSARKRIHRDDRRARAKLTEHWALRQAVGALATSEATTRRDALKEEEAERALQFPRIRNDNPVALRRAAERAAGPSATVFVYDELTSLWGSDELKLHFDEEHQCYYDFDGKQTFQLSADDDNGTRGQWQWAPDIANPSSVGWAPDYAEPPAAPEEEQAATADDASAKPRTSMMWSAQERLLWDSENDTYFDPEGSRLYDPAQRRWTHFVSVSDPKQTQATTPCSTRGGTPITLGRRGSLSFVGDDSPPGSPRIGSARSGSPRASRRASVSFAAAAVEDGSAPAAAFDNVPRASSSGDDSLAASTDAPATPRRSRQRKSAVEIVID